MLNDFPEGLSGLSEKRTHVRRPLLWAESEDSTFRALLAALLGLSLTCCAATNCMGGSIVYNIVNYADLQNGYTLSGAITTDGAIGTLTSADVTAWSFSVTGPTSYQASSQTAGVDLPNVTNLTSTATELTLAPPTVANRTNYFGLGSALLPATAPILTYQRSDGEDIY
jgi:hypothetical protein